MFCKHCGAELNPEQKFCKQCGTAVSAMPSSNVQATPQNVKPAIIAEEQKQPKSVLPKKKNKVGIIILIVFLSLAVFAGAAQGTYLLLNREAQEESDAVDEKEPPATYEKEETQKHNKSLDEEENEETPQVKKDISPSLHTHIQNVGGDGNISVAVIDNKTGDKYFGGNKNQKYSAWGFYLPIYLAYRSGDFDVDTSLLNQVMSNDPAVCNEAGNKIIRFMGGPESVTQVLSQNFRSSQTSYGRYFAQMNASKDNYTNAEEAVVFLNYLNQINGSNLLSYDLSKFGITAPRGATIYAQVGTENNAVRKQLNVFAIVKGENSDYCVAILTQDGMGTNISDLLELIHEEMEGIHA